LYGRQLSVVIIDEHKLFSEALALALRARGVTDVRAAAPSDPDAVLELMQSSGAAVALITQVGAAMASSLEVIERLSAVGRPVVVLDSDASPAQLAQCIEAGAAGYFEMSGSLDELVEAVQDAARGLSLMRPANREALLATLQQERDLEQERLAPFLELTQREQEVLAAIMAGLTADEIARARNVSVTTIRSQIRGVLKKLDVSTQIAAVARALQARWEPPT
jgi:DNA-binding NarL/FixJ family response regulator